MRLNPDLYSDLVREIILSEYGSLKMTTAFMFSGKQPLRTLRNFIEKIKWFKYRYHVQDSTNENDFECLAVLEWVSI